jgi:hypothetical protein
LGASPTEAGRCNSRELCLERIVIDGNISKAALMLC